MKLKFSVVLLSCLMLAFWPNVPLHAALPGKIVMTKYVKLTVQQRRQLPNTVVFRSHTERRAIYVLDPNTGLQRTLSNTCFDEMLPVVSPDGNKIAFTRLTSSAKWILIVSELRSGKERKILPSMDLFPICWIDNSNLIGCSDFKICIVDINSGRTHQIAEVESSPLTGSYSPASHLFYFENENHERESGESGFDFPIEIKSVNLTTGKVKYLFDARCPQISPDGQRLIINQKDKVLLFNLKSGQKLPVSSSADMAVFSPDGKYIAYLQSDGRQASVFIRDLNQKLIKKIPVGRVAEISW